MCIKEDFSVESNCTSPRLLTISCPVYQDGVILGADTRATDDMVVADKNCMKIHYIAPKI